MTAGPPPISDRLRHNQRLQFHTVCESIGNQEIDGGQTMPITQKVATRISAELKKYQSVLSNAKQRDVSESDTVLIVADMLADVFGYDKRQHVTTEHAIRGTYVDLAIVVDQDIRFSGRGDGGGRSRWSGGGLGSRLRKKPAHARDLVSGHGE